jgi:cytochrome c-type biogenesis protein CcmF
MFNNLILLVACFTVLWGTMFPVLSEWVQGTKVTVGPPFFNKVNIPAGILLLVLTGVGPLLAWRKTSFKSLMRNFMVPAIGAVITAAALMIGGVRPWEDQSYFYALVSLSLSALVILTIISEFYRGARVIRGHTGQNLLLSAVQLTRRNTRRYGGYIVHFGVVVIMIGFAGAAFYQNTEKELGRGDSMEIGPYKLVVDSYTQDDKPNYSSEWAIVNVFKNGKQIETMYPERRFYKASQQPSTIVANRSTLKEDLYIVFSGTNQDTGRPIIKAHLNPLVWWIWAGVHVILIGTVIALVPNMQAVKVTAESRVHAPARATRKTPVDATGDPVGAGD